MGLRPLAPLLFLCAGLAADSWGPPTPRRVVSPGGRHYAVTRLREDSWRLVLELCRRREGAAPIRAALGDDGFGEGKAEDTSRDPADPLLLTVDLDQTPLDFAVLDGEPAVVLFDQHAGVGYGRTFALLGSDGKLRWSVALKDLYGAQAIEAFTHSTSSIWWNAGWWVDEERGRIVVVAHADDPVREVNLKTGAVGSPGTGVLLTRIGRGPVADQVQALEFAAWLKPEGLAGKARPLAADPEADPRVRLRAAVAVRRAGGEVLLADLFAKHAGQPEPVEIHRYAVRHLGEMLGADRALPLLREVMKGNAGEAWSDAQHAFADLGEEAVPTLVQMLLDAQGSPDQRGGAAHALGEIRSPNAVEALLEATAEAGEYTANAAANALIATDPPGLGKRFAEILERGSTQDGRIALYFEEHPVPYAVGPLLAALDRTAPDSSERRWCADALRACTGKDFGEDPQAWRQGLGR